MACLIQLVYSAGGLSLSMPSLKIYEKLSEKSREKFLLDLIYKVLCSIDILATGRLEC